MGEQKKVDEEYDGGTEEGG
jgi:hypothetical protein